MAVAAVVTSLNTTKPCSFIPPAFFATTSRMGPNCKRHTRHRHNHKHHHHCHHHQPTCENMQYLQGRCHSMAKTRLKQFQGRDGTLRGAARPCAPCRSSCKRTCERASHSSGGCGVASVQVSRIKNATSGSGGGRGGGSSSSMNAVTHRVWLGWLGATALMAAALARQEHAAADGFIKWATAAF